MAAVSLDELKRRYNLYRERARDLYGRCAVSHDPHYVHESISINEHANAQMTEGGAFVEAQVWVPFEKLERPVPGE